MKNNSIVSHLPQFLGNIQKQKLAAQKKSKTGFDVARIEQERKNILDLNLVVGVDCSGSISATMFNDFMVQLNQIKGMSRIKVVEVSDIIEAVYDFSRRDRKVVRLKGGGGNGEDLFFPLAKKMKPDAIIYMTDGYCIGSEHGYGSSRVYNPGIPTAWILTANGVKPYNWGDVVGHLPH